MAFPTIDIGKAGRNRVVIAHCSKENQGTLAGMELGPGGDKRAGTFVRQAHNTAGLGNIAGLYVWDDADLAGLADDTAYEINVPAAGGANWVVQAELRYGLAGKLPRTTYINETVTSGTTIDVTGVTANVDDHVAMFVSHGDSVVGKKLSAISAPMVIRNPGIENAGANSTGAFGSGIATSASSNATLTATVSGTISTRAAGIAGVWAPAPTGITRFGTPTLITSPSGSADIGVAGNDRLVLIIAFREVFSSDPEALTGATVDGKACTLQDKTFVRSGAPGTTSTGIEVWSIHEDQLGNSAGSVTCAIQGGNNQWGFVVGVRYGVAQRDAIATYTGTNNDSTTVDLTGVNASVGDLVLTAAAVQELDLFSSWTSPLVEQFDDDFNPEGAENGQGGFADAVLTGALNNQTLTATSSASNGRLVAVGGVWTPARNPRQHYSAINNIPASTTSDTFQDYLTLTETFDNGSDYLVFWAARGGNLVTTSPQDLEIRLIVDGVGINQLRTDPDRLNDRNAFGGLYRFTGDGTSKSIDIAYRSTDAGTDAVQVEQASLVVIRLQSDDHVASSSGREGTTSEALKVSLTFDATAGDYLFLASAQMNGGDVGGEFKLTDSGGTTVIRRSSYREEASSDWLHQMAIHKESLSAGSVTRELRYGAKAANLVEIRQAWLVALRWDDFDNAYYDDDGHPDDTVSKGSTTSETFVDTTLSLGFTPENRAHLILSSQDFNADRTGAAGNRIAYHKLVGDGVDKFSPLRSNDLTTLDLVRGTAFWPTVETLPASPRTWKTQIRTENADASAKYANGTLAVLQLGFSPITGTGAAAAPAQTASGAGTLGPVPPPIDTNDGGGRIVDTRKRERAEEEGRRERDAREAERRKIIDRVFREVIDGLPPALADDPDLVERAVAEELARQGLDSRAKEIAALIAARAAAHRRAVEQRDNDALALLLLTG